MIDDPKKIAELDRGGMLSLVAAMPEMLLQAEKLSERLELPRIKKVESVVLAGMGGSAMGGEIARSLTSDLPVLLNRFYSLPGFVNDRSLLIASSYSGDTEEVISCVKEARQKNIPVIVLTSGGKLAEIAEAEKYPKVIVPAGLPPRAALAYLTLPVLKVLEKLGYIKNLSSQLQDTGKLLGNLKDEYLRGERTNPAKQLARKLQDKVPIILASPGVTRAAGIRFRCQLNENSKMVAHLALFPELNHNEIVGLAQLKRGSHNFAVVALRDEEDHGRVHKRIEITKSLIGANLGGVNEVFSTGKSRLARLFSLIYLADFVSVYLALLQGLDPTPVEVISRLKKELQR
jgi:glucose/mannose-6-phosphate isomerase